MDREKEIAACKKIIKDDGCYDIMKCRDCPFFSKECNSSGKVVSLAKKRLAELEAEEEDLQDKQNPKKPWGEFWRNTAVHRIYGELIDKTEFTYGANNGEFYTHFQECERPTPWPPVQKEKNYIWVVKDQRLLNRWISDGNTIPPGISVVFKEIDEEGK